jgi:cysteine desulfurase/selenocysteine lyase
MRALNVVATTRASFYLYNDISDVDALVAGILKAQLFFNPPKKSA